MPTAVTNATVRLSVIVSLFALLVVLAPLTGCNGSAGNRVDNKPAYPLDQDDARERRHGRLTGEGGLRLFGGGDDRRGGGGGSGIGVNSFLWRATLDTVNFMPLAQVDPHGGVIITDWYENPEAPGERFKLNVLIMGTELRSDGVRVSVFRQKKQGNSWRDAEAAGDTSRQLEDKILTRARELRIQNAS